MKKSRVALAYAAAVSAGLCWLPGLSQGATTYVGNDGAGIPWGNNYDKISSVVITTGYENIQANSATPPADAVTAPAIFFQINVNPGTTSSPTDITSSSQWWADYQIGMETSAGGGDTSVTTPYSNPIGISTGMNYWVAAYNTRPSGATSSTVGDNQVYGFSGGAWTQVAGGGGSPYLATSTVITPTSITVGIPLSDLGLTTGNTFNFDVYTTYGVPGGQSAYDVLDNTSFPANYYPYSNGAGTPTPYDSATAPGSTYSTTTYTVATPTLTWNDGGAASGYFDGVTWDTNDTTKFNWNNGIFADYYVDGSNVVFNDNNNGNYSVTLPATVQPASIVVNNSAGNYSISGAGSIAGTASLSKSGSGTLTLATANTFSGGVSVMAGELLIQPTTSTTSALPKGPLSITGGSVVLANGVTAGSQSSNVPVTAPTSNVNLTSLTISGGGTLDIGNNHIIIDYTSGNDPIASVRKWIVSGYNKGTWTGNGITSSDAATNASRYGVAYADAADTGNPAGLASGQIEVAYTLLGDANLDGKVNGTDFAVLATNFNKAATGWDQGDFNYDGSVNGTDFAFLATNFNQGASQADIAALNAFAAAHGLALTNVPEPATAALLTAGAMALLSRRRRNRGHL